MKRKYFSILLVISMILLAGCNEVATEEQVDETVEEEAYESSSETENIEETDESEADVIDETTTLEETNDIEEEQDEDQSEQYSAEFIEYNQKYYDSFIKYHDLLQSNFELLADGQASSLLVEDLTIWTGEFDELLDVYQQDAKPNTDCRSSTL